MQALLLSQIRRRSRLASQQWLMCMDRRLNREWMITWRQGDGPKVCTFGNRLQETEQNVAEYLALFFSHNYHKLKKLMLFSFFLLSRSSCVLLEVHSVCRRGQLQSARGEKSPIFPTKLPWQVSNRVLHFCWMIIVPIRQRQYTKGIRGGVGQWQRGRMVSSYFDHPLLFKEETIAITHFTGS